MAMGRRRSWRQKPLFAATEGIRALEQAVDMFSGALCAVTVQPTTGGDCRSLPKTPEEAGPQLERLGLEAREVVCEKGCHSNATMRELAGRDVRGYASDPNRAAGFNPRLLMRSRFGSGTPRSLQGRSASALRAGAFAGVFSVLFGPESGVPGRPAVVWARIIAPKRSSRFRPTARPNCADIIFRAPRGRFATAC